jgi:hypothetical protein
LYGGEPDVGQSELRIGSDGFLVSTARLVLLTIYSVNSAELIPGGVGVVVGAGFQMLWLGTSDTLKILDT